MNVRPMRDYVFFQFVDPTGHKAFGGRTQSGIEIPIVLHEQAGVPRWGQVTAVGPEVKNKDDIAVGKYVLVDAGRWSSGFTIDDKKYWQTKEEWCSAVSDDPIYSF